MAIANDTDWIRELRVSVTSNSNRVYANGRQQVELSVDVTPAKNIEFTQEQLDSITLVIKGDNGVFYNLSASPQPGRKYIATTERENRFEYYAASGHAPQPVSQTSSRRKVFYLSSNASGGSLQTVYAGIMKDENTYYCSQTSKFNSFAIVESISPPRKVRSDFLFELINHHSEAGDSYDLDFDLYHLEFADRKLKIVESIAYAVPSGVSHYTGFLDERGWGIGDFFQWPGPYSRPSIYQYSHYAFAVGEPQVVFDIPINSRPGAMDFVRYRYLGARDTDGTYAAPSRWGLVDQYGNEYKIEMTQERDGNVINFKMYE